MSTPTSGTMTVDPTDTSSEKSYTEISPEDASVATPYGREAPDALVARLEVDPDAAAHRHARPSEFDRDARGSDERAADEGDRVQGGESHPDREERRQLVRRVHSERTRRRSPRTANSSPG